MAVRMQDTSLVQIKLIALLQRGRHQLTVVGDDAQSIYAFRAATNRAFHTLQAELGVPVDTVSLEANYRSTPAIINVRARLLPCFVYEPCRSMLKLS